MVDDVIRDFLNAVVRTHRSGSATEPSYYPHIRDLLGAIGAGEKPRIVAEMSLKDADAGLPDGGLFTVEQFQEKAAGWPGKPNRGAIEVKLPNEDLNDVLKGEQVERYAKSYGQVLVTNLRDWALVEHRHGATREVERLTLSATDAEFWRAAGRKKFADERAPLFRPFLRRAMLHAAPLASPEDLARLLALYAQEALRRVESAETDDLDPLRTALSEALGLDIRDAQGEHFFRSSLVQTLFYGIFSAWVLWSEGRPTDSKEFFDWRSTDHYIGIPAISALYHHVATPGGLKSLDLVPVLDWAGAALDRVDRPSFFQRFQEAHAVQYFYEPFLKAFDPDLRKTLGVWYTPPEVVTYMVERVDQVLRTELNVKDGLANPDVYVLDPCCGTGSYLLAVLDRIYRTVRDKEGEVLGAQAVKQAACSRVAGFEILPAPFVVAHLQIGLLFHRIGAPMEENDRAAIYLTNALTGWAQPDAAKDQQLRLHLAGFNELFEERDRAGEVKRDAPILVVLGNPPYNAFAGVSPEQEEGLVEPYKEGLTKRWGIKKYNLDDFYVRFFRIAERRIAEQTGRGVVSYISNYSWLGHPSFVVMREHIASNFNQIWIDDLNGDKFSTGKKTPDGKPDPSIFSTPFNPAGIEVGTSIALMVRMDQPTTRPVVRYRAFWGTTKRQELVESLNNSSIESAYEIVNPEPRNRYSFRSDVVTDDWYEWPSLENISQGDSIQGLDEDRKLSLIHCEFEQLHELMRAYYSESVSWEEFSSFATGLSESAAGFDPQEVRNNARNEERFDPDRIVRYLFKPFDVRWSYYSLVPNLWKRPRPEYNRHRGVTPFIVSRRGTKAAIHGAPMYYTSYLIGRDFTAGKNATVFPFRRITPVGSAEPNLSVAARTYLASLNLNSEQGAEKIWLHALAIGYSPAYQHEHEHALRRDWPHVPLPDSAELLRGSAALGSEIAALLDMEAEVLEVTDSPLRPALALIGVPTSVESGGLVVEALALTAGWGHFGGHGEVMPGGGRWQVRDYTDEERAALEAEAGGLGMRLDEVLAVLGDHTVDVYLNDLVYWCNVPRRVWDYHIGGYQVIKKWLSYRERKILGRSLHVDEAREVMKIARRLSALRLLEPRLDANYHAVKESAAPWAH